MSATSDKTPTPSDESEDFILVDEDLKTESSVDKPCDLPERLKATDKKKQECRVDLHTLSDANRVLCSIKTPQEPEQSCQHVPVDIVLVIDISGSMHAAAPLPDTNDESEKESAGLSILDLVKHASRTILETLNDGDRLAIVTFSDDATTVQTLTPMDDTAKTETWTRIESLAVEGCTNLWSGIRTGLSLFDDHNSSAIPALLVLTDGMPNHMCPPQGYVNKLQPMLKAMPQAPTIHTFGFGYSIRSALLQSIAEVGRGSYAFIPDAGMIGTVFIHAVANLYNSFASNAVLEVKTHPRTKLSCSTVFNIEGADSGEATLFLGNLQYGQSRDLILDLDRPSASPAVNITVRLTFQNNNSSTTLTAGGTTAIRTQLPGLITSYHTYRSELCSLLSLFTPIAANNEHTTLDPESSFSEFFSAKVQLDVLAHTIRSSPHADDLNIASLLADICGDGEAGQVMKALQTSDCEPELPSESSTDSVVVSNNGTGVISSVRSSSHNNNNSKAKTARKSHTRHRSRHGPIDKSNFHMRWGQHYLPSLLHAHARQLCNSFKDPGPLRYGIDAPLFVRCRTELDAAFDALPAPKPSRVDKDGQASHVSVSMGRYHNSRNPCFAASARVRLADGVSLCSMEELRRGMSVCTPRGPRRVFQILRTPYCEQYGEAGEVGSDLLVRVDGSVTGDGGGGSLWVTRWHPVLHYTCEGPGQVWVYPIDVATEVKVCQEDVYSVLLEKDEDPEASAIEVDGVWAVTWGHGLTRADERDVRGHAFFGDRNKVMLEMLKLPVDAEGRRVTGGVRRKNGNLVGGLLWPDEWKRQMDEDQESDGDADMESIEGGKGALMCRL